MATIDRIPKFRSPERAYYYAKNLRRPVPELEKVIKKDPSCALKYAEYIIRGRWPNGEEAISKCPCWACYYATRVIKGKCSDIIETGITEDYKYTLYYAIEILGYQLKIKDGWEGISVIWHESEESIRKDSLRAYLHARHTIKGRWIDGEEVISKNSELAYWYTRDVIKGKCSDVIERGIANDPERAISYLRMCGEEIKI